ncbi:MAG: hypothetical protein IT324_16920 [Anaerolineae bacterium]|nr:hypothetical protein [Anaerolineae bacterium]
MTNDRDLFNTFGNGFPLYEGKMIHQYDAYYEKPRFWIDPSAGRKRILGRTADEGQKLGYQQYRLAVRAIARSTDLHTLISTVLPTNCFAGNSLLVDQAIDDPKISLYVSAVMNSLCLDSILRLKVAANVNMFYVYQLPLPRLNPGDPYFDAIVPRAARLTCTRPEFAELWQAVMGEAWNESKGATDPAVRQQLRDEIDALVARLYGLTRADFDHILGTFPLVFPDTAEGRARRAALLATYDRLDVTR